MTDEPAEDQDGRPLLAWLVIFISWTFALAEFRKAGRKGPDRTAVIVQMNRIYFVASAALVAAIIVASGNTIACLQWNPSNDGTIFRSATFLLATYCLSRCIEVFYAFFRDAFDRLADREPDSDLQGRRRIGLALTSYAEMILNFGMLLSLVTAEAWQTTNANPPKHITDVLFYSASTITTSGGGGFVPKGAIVQALTVFEIACGLILLVVCFAIYAGGRTQRPEA